MEGKIAELRHTGNVKIRARKRDSFYSFVRVFLIREYVLSRARRNTEEYSYNG